jgi:hypothetical protein
MITFQREFGSYSHLQFGGENLRIRVKHYAETPATAKARQKRGWVSYGAKA